MSITFEVLDRLEYLASVASAAPWRTARFDDEYCMSAIGVIMTSASGYHDRVAACLVQQPAYVVPEDERWDENAELIASARNALAELVRLARIGLATEDGSRPAS